MNSIKSIKAKEILDSRGSPTVAVELETDHGLFSAATPSGVSTGEREAIEIRDGGERYNGKGVLRAVKNINEILSIKLVGKSPEDQKHIDELMLELDGTPNKSNLGANAILPVSIAVSRAGAKAKGIFLWKYLSELAEKDIYASMPRPSVLLMEGGLHSDSGLGFQEFMVVVDGKSFTQEFKNAVEIYQKLGTLLKLKYGKQGEKIGVEGGFAPPISKTEQALDLIVKAIKDSNLKNKTKIIIDVAASSFYKNKRYYIDGKSFSTEELLDFYSYLIDKYPIAGIEDPFEEDDWQGFGLILKKLGDRIFIIGDDLLTTNIRSIKKAIKENTVNALIIKPNQVGTVTETIEAIQMAKTANWKVFVKHRGGETYDSFISDLAVGLSADYIMAGGPFKPERKAKYDRLLKIEKEINLLNKF